MLEARACIACGTCTEGTRRRCDDFNALTKQDLSFIAGWLTAKGYSVKSKLIKTKLRKLNIPFIEGSVYNHDDAVECAASEQQVVLKKKGVKLV